MLMDTTAMMGVRTGRRATLLLAATSVVAPSSKEHGQNDGSGICTQIHSKSHTLSGQWWKQVAVAWTRSIMLCNNNQERDKLFALDCIFLYLRECHHSIKHKTKIGSKSKVATTYADAAKRSWNGWNVNILICCVAEALNTTVVLTWHVQYSNVVTAEVSMKMMSFPLLAS